LAATRRSSIGRAVRQLQAPGCLLAAAHPTTHAIEVEKPKAFMFGPTQFTFLQLLTEEGMDVRPMSLATSPTRPHLEYAVRLSDSPYKRAFAALQPED
jgi:ferredoxin-NADP reductase